MTPRQTVTLPDGRMLDVLVLQRIASHMCKKQSVRISSLSGISEHPDSGFSLARLAATSLKYPIIIGHTRLILDGRHRALRLLRKGRKPALCVMLSEFHVREAQLSKQIGEDSVPGKKV